VNEVVVPKKKERWSNKLDRSEKWQNDSFLKINYTHCSNELKKLSFLYWTTTFSKDFDKNDRFLL